MLMRRKSRRLSTEERVVKKLSEWISKNVRVTAVFYGHMFSGAVSGELSIFEDPPYQFFEVNTTTARVTLSLRRCAGLSLEGDMVQLKWGSNDDALVQIRPFIDADAALRALPVPGSARPN